MTASATERAADYHRDWGENGPSLSSSIACLLHLKTPAHAWAAHPRLNPDYQDESSAAMDMGTSVHQLLLRDDRVDVANYPDFRTKAAQEWRDTVRAQGRVPMLNHKWLEAQEIAAKVREQVELLNVDPTPFTHGEAEHTIRFTVKGAECRAMLDWLHTDRQWIDDLKTTTDANPRKVERHIFNMGYDIRAAFYIRAVEAEYGITPGFRWIFAETKPPYPVSIVTLDEGEWMRAHAKVDQAIALWNQCLETGEWPAYPRDIHVVTSPPWMREDPWATVDVGEEVPF